jgi:hypothetical protein
MQYAEDQTVSPANVAVDVMRSSTGDVRDAGRKRTDRCHSSSSKLIGLVFYRPINLCSI